MVVEGRGEEEVAASQQWKQVMVRGDGNPSSAGASVHHVSHLVTQSQFFEPAAIQDSPRDLA